MINPILKSKQSIYYYLLGWALIAIVHWFILYYFYEVEVWLALQDSLIFNLIFCGLALNYWYVVKFINIESFTPLNIVINHLVTASIGISIWLFGGFAIIKFLNKDEAEYNLFLSDTLPARFLVGLFFYSVIILLYYLFTYYSNLQEKIKKEAELQTLIKEAELNVLKSQINPHFIFNSLNSISSLTILKPAQAREMIIKLSEFLRYSLDQDMKQKTLLKNELENIRRYLEIEKIRFGARLRFEMDIQLGGENGLLPNLILQPLLENAIKHGVHESTEPITIEIKCAMENDYLKIIIKNNYDPEVAVKKRTGIGLKNIQNRLQLIYGRVDLFKINNFDNTFEVFLFFPQ